MVHEDELLQACEVLFGRNVVLSRDFLHYLEISGVKTAYRKRAKETHPDLNNHVRHVRDTSVDFIRVREAYDRLLRFLTLRGSRSSGHQGARAWPARHGTRPRSVHRPNNTSRNQRTHAPDRESFRRNQTTETGTQSARACPPGATASGTDTAPRARFKGPIPRRRLLIGHYLYYAGRADWRTVIQAVGWQMIQRPRLGELASRYGWLQNRDVHRITVRRRALERFGDTAVRLRILTPFQVKVLLAMQTRRQRRIGDFFVEQGLFTREELDALVRACSAHNESLSEPARQAS